LNICRIFDRQGSLGTGHSSRLFPGRWCFRTAVTLDWRYVPRRFSEDLTWVTLLHRHFAEKGADFASIVVPDPMCGTKLPRIWQSLSRQRRGGRRVARRIVLTRGLFFIPATANRLFCFAYLWCLSCCSVIEILGIVSYWFLRFALGVLSRALLLQFLLFGYAFLRDFHCALLQD